MQEHAAPEVRARVEAYVDEFCTELEMSPNYDAQLVQRALRRGLTVGNWFFDIIEQDPDEHVQGKTKFDSIIIIKREGGRTGQELEIMSNFDFDNSLFKHTIPSYAFRAVDYRKGLEQTATFEIRRGGDADHFSAVSSEKNGFGSRQELLRKDNLSTNESQCE